MATVIYLDVDDEITSAAARIRAAEAVRIALVLPAGSHLATSRINFRLLAREAQGRSRQLLIVAPDAAARALAASAGLPVYASVRELDAETGAGAPSDETGAAAMPGLTADSTGKGPTASGAIAAPSGPSLAPSGAALAPSAAALGTSGASATDDTAVLPLPQPTGRSGARDGARPAARADDRRVAERDVPVAALPDRGRRTAIAAMLVVLAVLLLVGGVLGYVLLPAATIVVTPRIEAIGPLTFPVRAEIGVTAPDALAGVVPASVATLPLEESGEFPATGTKIVETRAHGTVTFSNIDPFAQHTIDAGSVVQTAGGVKFATQRVLILNNATIVMEGNKRVIVPTTGDVAVSAVDPGTGGNVAAGTIKIVPSDQDPNKIEVNNGAHTTGGTHTETLVVAQKDIDKATATLTQRLRDDLATVLANPAGVLPDVTVFPETKALTKPVPSVDPATLLGKPMNTFTYGLTANGSVTTVDESAVRDVAEVRLRAGVGPDHDLVRDSLRISVGKGSVLDSTIVFPVNASASRLRRLDASQLRSQVRGRTIADARAALSPYGEVSIDTWPGFVSSIPTYDFRLDLSINAPAPVESAGASPTAGGDGAGPGASMGTDGALPSGAGETAGP